jgi:hypothetical protein
VKATIYDVLQKLENMEKRERRRERQDFQPIDYSEYFEFDESRHIMLYKHKKIYYKDLTKLYRAVGDTRDVRTFRKMCRTGENAEIWAREIQRVPAVFIESINKYLTCEGLLLFSNLSPMVGNPNNSEQIITINGERKIINRASEVWRKFVDENAENNVFIYQDRDYGNCDISNLVEKKK